MRAACCQHQKKGRYADQNIHYALGSWYLGDATPSAMLSDGENAVLVQFDCASVYRVSQERVAVLDPRGYRGTGPQFPVFGSGFRVLLPVTHNSKLETEDPCTQNRPGSTFPRFTRFDYRADFLIHSFSAAT